MSSPANKKMRNRAQSSAGTSTIDAPESAAAIADSQLSPIELDQSPLANAGMPRGTLKEIAKVTGRGIATLLVAPFLVSYWLRAALLGRDRALEGSTELLSLIPGVTGQYLRRAFLARVLVRCHPSASIGFGVVFSKTGARIDENVYIGPRCHIGLVHIERDALLAAGVHVTSGAQTHGFADLTKPIREQPTTQTRVRIGAGAWIGSAAIVMADVGRDTVVGAGSVVTKALPDQVIVAGVPARVLRRRDEQGHEASQ